MKKSQFNFILPEELIAQYPLPNRGDSRLLTYNRTTESCEHHQFKSIADFFEPGDLLVLNDSRVIPARLYGHKESGGRVELLVERLTESGEFLSHIKASKSIKPGGIIYCENNWIITIIGRQDDLYHCRIEGDVDVMLHDIGHIPLPPYITRADDAQDLNRYQTVYAKHKGSVAAPTAGLHFDQSILENLTSRGVVIAYSTLHVGAGTFRPVRCDEIKDHKMHSEHFTVSQSLCDAVNTARDSNKRVIAVGTTALRSLESAALHGDFKACSRDTNIFISPGYKFKICDGLITNFHLPESTLLMLVSALIGHKQTMELYRIAIENGYRFFSYGDASLLL